MGKENGFYENPDNCRKYYECEFEQTFIEICPGDELYAGDAVCDIPERVDCGDRPVCDDNNENCYEREETEMPVNLELQSYHSISRGDLSVFFHQTT